MERPQRKQPVPGTRSMKIAKNKRNSSSMIMLPMKTFMQIGLVNGRTDVIVNDYYFAKDGSSRHQG